MFTAFAIDGRLYNHSSHFLHLFFQFLATAGDGKRLFVARRVCRTWKSFIDELKPLEYAEIFKAASPNKTLVDFLSANLEPNRFVCLLSESTDGDMTHALRKTLRASRADQSLRGVDPLVWMLLHHLVAIAFESAQTGKHFSAAFDNAWRGYAFYAVFCAWQVSKPGDRNQHELTTWWKLTLSTLQKRVQDSLARAPLLQQLAARKSLVNFVDKMLEITFHSCRPSIVGSVNSFTLLSENIMAHWNWPT
tara:strand:- start:287 stop:1033 length:747 start_codon:yes stop_codon:yes gene_type:complete